MTTLALTHGSPTQIALWSRHLAVFAVQLVLLTILLHRFLGLPTPVALNLFLVGLAGAALALAISLVAALQIWIAGRGGAMNAAIGCGVAMLLLLWPAAYAPIFMGLPTLYDVTTDTAAPPPFVALAKSRPADANAVAYSAQNFAAAQIGAYPDVRPFVIPRSVTDGYDLVVDVVHRLRWDVVAEETPKLGGRPGTIEATDRTLILGFRDDIAIRVSGDQERTRIDIRSQSRYGQHDLGRNASRIRGFYQEVLARLDGTSLVERRGRRRARAEPPRPVKGEPSQKEVRPSAPGPEQSGAQREPPSKAKQRVPVERRSRDKQ